MWSKDAQEKEFVTEVIYCMLLFNAVPCIILRDQWDQWEIPTKSWNQRFLFGSCLTTCGLRSSMSPQGSAHPGPLRNPGRVVTLVRAEWPFRGCVKMFFSKSIFGKENKPTPPLRLTAQDLDLLCQSVLAGKYVRSRLSHPDSKSDITANHLNCNVSEISGPGVRLPHKPSRSSSFVSVLWAQPRYVKSRRPWSSTKHGQLGIVHCCMLCWSTSSPISRFTCTYFILFPICQMSLRIWMDLGFSCQELFQDHSPTHDILRDLFTVCCPDRGNLRASISADASFLQTHSHWGCSQVFLWQIPMLHRCLEGSYCCYLLLNLWLKHLQTSK